MCYCGLIVVKRRSIFYVLIHISSSFMHLDNVGRYEIQIPYGTGQFSGPNCKSSVALVYWKTDHHGYCHQTRSGVPRKSMYPKQIEENILSIVCNERP